MFKKKGISLSPSLYFVTALSYMALGLFSTLIIGLIMKTIGGQLEGTTFTGMSATLIQIGDVAMSLTGPAIGIAIAYALEAPPLILFSALVVGAFGYEFGPAGSYVATILAVEVSKLVSKSTKLDILVTPFTTIAVGYLTATYIGKYVGLFMTQLGGWIEWGTEQQPLFMGVVVATLMGLALTAPISSAAIALMLGLNGIAAGAATVGCAAQMIGFAITSYRDNGVGGAIAQGIGTSMLQVGNIVKNPWILLPPTMAGAVLAPIAILLFELESVAAGAGMGTSGLVGPIVMLETMGFSWYTFLVVFGFLIIGPALLSYAVYVVLRRTGRIQPNDLKIDY
ncbi:MULTISPECIES: PTS transporter subunit IIC [unclassified Exiguobacterium]|uniref:Phosphotransferase system EIIC n=1 Tax=Exiguobacterium sp. (strain ATCC BAA-1283 / AT1b) TaxID=360911 RepID=C4L4P7_EXISA|nr:MULTISPECIES: PTS sugar transporter subunit IIC [unclassified Exiguobacterium]ACQ69642.1 phosphotransferase system EIIC [Exiguobacterium sp. AT1b]